MAGEGSPGSGPDKTPDKGGQPDARPEGPPSPPPAAPGSPAAPPERIVPPPADRPEATAKPAGQGDGDRPAWSHREPGAGSDAGRDHGGSPLAPRGGPDRGAADRDQAARADAARKAADAARQDADQGRDRRDDSGRRPDAGSTSADEARAAADRARAAADTARAKAPGGWTPDRGRPAFAQPAEGNRGGRADGPEGKGGDKAGDGKDKADKPGRIQDLRNRIDRVGGPHRFAGRVVSETVKHMGERARDLPKDAGRTALRKTVEGGRAAKEGAKNHVAKSVEKAFKDVPRGKSLQEHARDKIHEAYMEQRRQNHDRRVATKEFKHKERVAYKDLKRDGTRSTRQIKDGRSGPRHPRLHPIRHARWNRGPGRTIRLSHHLHGVSYQDQHEHGTPHPGNSAQRLGPKQLPGFHTQLTHHQWKHHPDNPSNKGK